MKLIVIGAGAMGLAASYHAAKAGHEVLVLEAGAEPGGMAAHFDFDGLSIERFYHFICSSDYATFDLLKELGLENKLRWRKTTMGYFIGGKLHEWGNPIALLKLPGVSLLAKLRYGLLAFISTKRKNWDTIENESAKSWIERWAGKEAYSKLWERLFKLKFYELADDISAAWIWRRIKRIGLSRRSMFEEQLGYLEGGSEVLIEHLVKRIRALGGTVRTNASVSRVEVEQGRVIGVTTPLGFSPADAVIMTVPTPLVSTMVPALPEDLRVRYEAIKNIGVICLLFKLQKQVTPHFWVNVSEPDIDVPGIIEFSNLRTVSSTIVFVPYYMPVTNRKWNASDEALIEEAFGYLKRINPGLTDADRLAFHVARLRYAQPVCEPGFAAKLPPIKTPIIGLQIADTAFYYPEDRGISESVRLGREMAAQIDAA